LGLLVLAQPNEAAMPKVPFRRPLDKLELTKKNRPEPSAICHSLGRESCAPMPPTCFRQICERTRLNLQWLEFLDEFPAELEATAVDVRAPASGLLSCRVLSGSPPRKPSGRRPFCSASSCCGLFSWLGRPARRACPADNSCSLNSRGSGSGTAEPP